MPRNEHRSRRRFDQSRGDPHERGFPGAIVADEGDEFRVRNREAHVVERDDLVVLLAEIGDLQRHVMSRVAHRAARRHENESAAAPRSAAPAATTRATLAALSFPFAATAIGARPAIASAGGRAWRSNISVP